MDVCLRQQFIREVNAGYADMRRDDLSWLAHRSDLAEWEDFTGMDGVPPPDDDDPNAP